VAKAACRAEAPVARAGVKADSSDARRLQQFRVSKADVATGKSLQKYSLLVLEHPLRRGT
jgi:hypothetical protein